MPFPFFPSFSINTCRYRLRLSTVLVSLALAACAGKQAIQQDADEDTQPERTAVVAEAQESESGAPLPNQDLTETVLYEFLLAEIAGQRGNVGLSAQAYVDLAKRTRDPRVARRATEIALYARMNSAAIEAARIWYEVEPGSIRALQALSGLLLSVGRYDEAMPYTKQVLAQPGANPEQSFGQLARTLANAQDKSAALRLMRSLAADHPRLPQAHVAVAQVADNAGDLALALAETREALKLRPDSEAAVLLQAQLVQRRSGAEAASLLNDFLKRYPNSREVRLNYARMLVSEKRFANARAEFQKLLADFPNNTDVVLAVALLSMQLNDYAVAESNLKRLLDSSYRDKNSVRLYLGQVAEEQKKLDEALRWYGDVNSGEQYVPAQVRYAQILAKQGKLDDARARLQQASANNTQQRVQLVLAEAQLLREAKQNKTAFEVVQQALDRQPNQPDLLYDYAMLAEKIERVDLLESSLKKLITIRPEHAHAYNALGYSLAERNERLPEARELIEKALKIAPDDFFIMDSMGWVLYRMGYLKEALGYLERAYSGRPDPEIAAHLGEVLWMLGQRDEAERVLRNAADKTPESDLPADTLKRLKR
jgi:tetratricopeptide (TPR) repeat protein